MGRPKNFSREGVLEKALPVFWRSGFAEASLHELEVATGVNKSGLYSEFKDKEDLFTQSLQYYLESLEKKELLTAEPLGWNNIERFLKLGPCNLEGHEGSCWHHNSKQRQTKAAHRQEYRGRAPKGECGLPGGIGPDLFYRDEYGAQ